MQNFPNNIVLTSLYYSKYYTMCRRLSISFWWPIMDRSGCRRYDKAIRSLVLGMPRQAAEEVIPQFPEIRHWYIAGHSMGGAMASQFASDHPDQVDGLILMGAYIYGDYPGEDTLAIYGSLNQSVEAHIDYTENIVEIEGGNHAQFGNYGPQKGDPPATISAEAQQKQTVEAVEAFLAQRK